MNCRHCSAPLEHTFLDLGFAPFSNAYLKPEELNQPETYFPLKLNVCAECWLVQTEDYARPAELFRDDYAYFSSVSTSWLEHAAQYSQMVIDRFDLSAKSFVLEIASNDGYLLRNFVEADIPCLGIEPTTSTADAAEELGISVLREFFTQKLGETLAKESQQADLIVGNNVYAHVPDINDFTAGMKSTLKPGGVITLEFPHLMRLIAETQFDTVYHEHFSYLSLYTVINIFERAGLRVFDVEELSTHGGSLRVFGCHDDDPRPTAESVSKMIASEELHGLRSLTTYTVFQERADQVKNDLLDFLISQRRTGKSVAAYGAAAKGNTLLNYAGVKPDLLAFVADAAPSKQGRFLPGSHIPIKHPDAIQQFRPDFVLILPWNLKTEISAQLTNIRNWSGQFTVAIPELTVL